jgi:hypothetical protein
MDNILLNNWLLYPIVAYLSLAILKWQYVVQGIPRMVKYIQIFKPEMPRHYFWFLNIWLPLILLPGSVFVVPFDLYYERRSFFRPYPDSELREIAAKIAEGYRC